VVDPPPFCQEVNVKMAHSAPAVRHILVTLFIRQRNTVRVPHPFPRLLRKRVEKRFHCFLAGSIMNVKSTFYAASYTMCTGEPLNFSDLRGRIFLGPVPSPRSVLSDTLNDVAEAKAVICLRARTRQEQQAS
jgi:hypothetical protein